MSAHLLHRVCALALSVVLLCGGVSCKGTDATGPSENPDPVPPACAASELALTGTLDGVAVNERVVGVGSYSFLNKFDADPGTLDTYQGAVALHLEFEQYWLADGESAPSRGWLRTAKHDVGNCSTAPLSGTISLNADGSGVRFLLKAMHQAPYCSGSAVSGAVAGCFGYAIVR